MNCPNEGENVLNLALKEKGGLNAHSIGRMSLAEKQAVFLQMVESGELNTTDVMEMVAGGYPIEKLPNSALVDILSQEPNLVRDVSAARMYRAAGDDVRQRLWSEVPTEYLASKVNSLWFADDNTLNAAVINGAPEPLIVAARLKDISEDALAGYIERADIEDVFELHNLAPTLDRPAFKNSERMQFVDAMDKAKGIQAERWSVWKEIFDIAPRRYLDVDFWETVKRSVSNGDASNIGVGPDIVFWVAGDSAKSKNNITSPYGKHSINTQTMTDILKALSGAIYKSHTPEEIQRGEFNMNRISQEMRSGRWGNLADSFPTSMNSITLDEVAQETIKAAINVYGIWEPLTAEEYREETKSMPKMIYEVAGYRGVELRFRRLEDGRGQVYALATENDTTKWPTPEFYTSHPFEFEPGDEDKILACAENQLRAGETRGNGLGGDVNEAIAESGWPGRFGSWLKDDS